MVTALDILLDRPTEAEFDRQTARRQAFQEMARVLQNSQINNRPSTSQPASAPTEILTTAVEHIKVACSSR